MYTRDAYIITIARDKMAIRRSDHLFVSATFVFRLLSSLLVVVAVVARASDIHDYTGARQFGKKLVVSKHRNNTQRLPNYNWKPPDKHYGPRLESTAEKAAAEFARAEDPEQRAADPRIRKMQEISRQKGEKWASYKRNGSGKLAHDDVAGTARESELTNVESIAMPLFSRSAESDENAEEGSGAVDGLFEGGVGSSEARRETKSNTERPAVPETLARHSPVNGDSAGVLKDRQSLPRLDSIHGSDADGTSPEKKSRNDRWATGAKKPRRQFLREASVLATRQRQENGEETEDTVGKRNATTADREKGRRAEEDAGEKEDEEDRLLGSMVDSRPGKRRSRKGPPETPKVHTRRSFGEFSRESAGNSNHAGGRRPEVLTAARKEYPGRSGASRDDGAENDEGNADGRADEKVAVTADPLTRKSAERDDETGRKDATDRASLNHGAGSSFHPGRWGMSVSSPPPEFLRDITSRSMHQRNKERMIGGDDADNNDDDDDDDDDDDEEKDGRDHQNGRWGMSISSPPKEFLEDISMHQRHGVGAAAKGRSRPAAGEAAQSADDRALPLPPSRRSLRADRRVTSDERVREEFARTSAAAAASSSSSSTSLGQVPRALYNFEDRRMTLDAWRDYPASVDLGRKLLLESVRLLVRATSRSNIDLRTDVADLPTLCRVRIPIAALRV